MFVHNGGIAGFNEIKRDMINLLSDQCFQKIECVSDSEIFFLMIMSKLDVNSSNIPAKQIVRAIEKTMTEIFDLQIAKNIRCGSSINSVITDGVKSIALRYRSSRDDAPSLYILTRRGQVSLIEDDSQVQTSIHPIECNKLIRSKSWSAATFTENLEELSTICASEPLTKNEEDWKLIENNTFVIMNRVASSSATRPIEYVKVQLPQEDYFADAIAV